MPSGSPPGQGGGSPTHDGPGSGASVVVADAPDRHRYEARIADELTGVLEYVIKRDRIALVHTEVLPAFEGRGVAASLARWALDDARRRGRRVIASCPYVRRYLEKHPEDHDIVVGLGAPRDAPRPPGSPAAG